MRTFPAPPRSTRHARGRLSRRSRLGPRAAEAPSHRQVARRLLARLADDGASESGITLIEVVISAMLVGLIVIATFTGFDDATRAAANQRAHNQATLIAAQDEERLRGLNLTKLTQSGHETRELRESGTKYTIESFAEYVSGGKEADVLTCSSGGSADFIKSTTIVSWVEYGKNPPVTKSVKQSSIVSVPSSTTLEVKVLDQAKAPVSGASVTVKGASTNLSQTTLANGCVVLGSIADKTVEVNASKPGWVGFNGSPLTPRSVTLSSTATKSEEFTIAEPGTVNATFATNGTTTAGVTGDTIYVGQSGVGTPSNFVGGVAGTYGASVSQTGLFPFVAPGGAYTVYAGDCEKNSPESIAGSGGKAASAQVEPGQVTSVEVEVPKVNVVVWSGSSSTNKGAGVNSTSAVLTNSECASKSAQNHTPVPYKHSIKVVNGKLEPRYAPYAKSLELCVAFGPENGKYYKYKTSFANTKKEGTAETPFYAKEGFPTAYTSAQTC